MKWSLPITLNLLALMTTSACIGPAQDGRLYRRDQPAVSRFHVASSTADSTEIEADLSDGTRCQGRLSRTDAADESVSPDSDVSATTNGGIGVLICRSNAVIRCRFVHRVGMGYAYGECVDQTGIKYTVLF